MRVVYIVLAHTAPRQLGRLVERLDGDHARFLIHIDKGTPQEKYELSRRLVSSNSRVTFLDRRSTQRTTFGLVAVPLNALALLIRERESFDYVILLSGQDYPIKSSDYIVSFLKQHSGTSFLHAFPIEDLARSDWSARELFRYRNWHFWINGRHGSVRLNRSIPGGLEPFGGSMQWGLSRDAVLHITDFVEREPRFVKFFRHTFVPDEMFFHTILMNSGLRDRIATLSAPCCYGLHYIDWLPNQDHPETLRLSDVPKLRSTPALFARKFDCEVDPNVLDAIDRELLA